MRASTPIPCSVPCRIWKVEACCRLSALPGVPSQPTIPYCKLCAANAPPPWPRDFLQQMHALGMTAAEVETLLRETETSEKE